MKKYFLLLFAFVLTGVYAQNKEKVQEFGIQFRNLDNFGFIYKIKLNENKFLRLSSASIRYSTKNYHVKNNMKSIGFGIGKEHRYNLDEKLNYFIGPQLNASFNHSKYDEVTNQLFSFGIGYILGIGYNINDKIKLAGEIIPSVQLNYNSGKKNKSISSEYTHQLNVGGTSNFINLTLTYQLKRKK